jgi:hypothetical protein
MPPMLSRRELSILFLHRNYWYILCVAGVGIIVYFFGALPADAKSKKAKQATTNKHHTMSKS